MLYPKKWTPTTSLCVVQAIVQRAPKSITARCIVVAKRNVEALASIKCHFFLRGQLSMTQILASESLSSPSVRVGISPVPLPSPPQTSKHQSIILTPEENKYKLPPEYMARCKVLSLSSQRRLTEGGKLHFRCSYQSTCFHWN